MNSNERKKVNEPGMDTEKWHKRTKRLIHSTQSIFNYIRSHPVPPTIKKICRIITRLLFEYKIQFPETDRGPVSADRFSVANTLFLHFICPFLVNPKAVEREIASKWPSFTFVFHKRKVNITAKVELKNARRSLILYAKLFQALANDNLFENPAMAQCSQFVIENRLNFDKFAKRVATVTSFTHFRKARTDCLLQAQGNQTQTQTCIYH